MKGIYFQKLGSIDEITIKDTERPKPKKHQVLVNVRASSLNYVDYANFSDYASKGRVSFLTRMMDVTVMPKINKAVGMEVAGVVVAVGPGVSEYKEGDEVMGITAGYHGGWAEYACLPTSTLSMKPSNFSFEEAATMCVSGMSAYGAVRSARIRKGQHVLIYGASGGVGQYALQLSKMAGARITAVCSTRNLAMAKDLGAETVIDYKKEDFSKNGKRYDVILGINGNLPLRTYRDALEKHGRYIAVGNMTQFMKGFMIGSLTSLFSSKKLGGSSYFFVNKKESLDCLRNGAEAGTIKPQIDSVHSAGGIKKAIEYVVEEHPQGKVVLRMDFR